MDIPSSILMNGNAGSQKVSVMQQHLTQFHYLENLDFWHVLKYPLFAWPACTYKQNNQLLYKAVLSTKAKKACSDEADIK